MFNSIKQAVSRPSVAIPLKGVAAAASWYLWWAVVVLLVKPKMFCTAALLSMHLVFGRPETEAGFQTMEMFAAYIASGLLFAFAIGFGAASLRAFFLRKDGTLALMILCVCAAMLSSMQLAESNSFAPSIWTITVTIALWGQALVGVWSTFYLIQDMVKASVKPAEGPAQAVAA